MAEDVTRLNRQVDHLTLVSQALWELLRDSNAYTEEQLMAKMQEIDLRDGQADGKIGMARVQCPRCQRISNSRRDACMYCGTEFQRDHVFEK